MTKRKKELEESDLFSFIQPEKIKGKEKANTKEMEKAPADLWEEKYYVFDITMKLDKIKEVMKEDMLSEGFSKREANKVFKGLVFKEIVWNTPDQAKENLSKIPTSYAMKYKYGIEPSPQMVSLAGRVAEKKEKLKTYLKAQNEKKFTGDFITCAHCKSKVNAKFIKVPLCPVCGQDMRTDRVVETIEKLKQTVASLSKKHEDITRKYHSKFTGGEKWIIRLVNPFKAAKE